MLHTETLKGETHERLKVLMRDERLKKFNLVGETALALYLGHRISIDLDLFTSEAFEARKLEKYLVTEYGFQGDYLEKNTLKGTIRDVKVDFITYDYPLVDSLITEDGVRLYSMLDIAAMKLSAIADDGSRLKDFIDIASLSTEYSLYDMLAAYEKKFKNSNVLRPIKGLIYFEDINFEEPIVMLNVAYQWEKIEKRLNEMLKDQHKVFEYLPI